MSAAPERAIAAKGLPSDGQSTSMVRSSAAGTRLPPMTLRWSGFAPAGRSSRAFMADPRGGSAFYIPAGQQSSPPARAARDQALQPRPQPRGRRALEQAVDGDRREDGSRKRQKHEGPRPDEPGKTGAPDDLAPGANHERMDEVERVGSVADRGAGPGQAAACAVAAAEGERRDEHRRRDAVGEGAKGGRELAVTRRHRDEHRKGRDGKERARHGTEADALRMDEPERHAVDELEDDRVGPEPQRLRQRPERTPDRDERGEDGGKAEHRGAPRASERQREQRVEEHLVVQRPAEAVERLHEPVRPGRRNEEIGGDDIGPAEEFAVEEFRHRERDREIERGDGPIDRHDAGDAAGEKGPAAAWGRKQRRRGVDHDEARDDEKHVDAGLPGKRGDRREGAAGALGKRCGVVLRVQHRDGQRRDGAQDLKQNELGQGSDSRDGLTALKA